MIGCKKFDHSYSEYERCELCDFADSLEGVYSGISSGIYDPFKYPYFSGDTFEYNVEHIFMNHGNYLDSTLMYFKVWGKFDFQQTYRYDTLIINSRSGSVIKDGYTTFWIKPDSMFVYYYYYTKMPVTKVYYKGYKQ